MLKESGVLVSYVVPVYNVEKYINTCIKSIQNQRYKNIEIIIIDDGTPDKSGEIIDEIAKFDTRIRVVHKDNEGVSTARNIGIDMAKGEYIVFVDGDDYIESDYTDYMLSLICDSNADMALTLNNYTDFDRMQSSYDYITTYSNDEALEAIYSNKINVAVWNKIYKKEFLEENNIRFCSEFWFAEGMTFNIECFQVARKIVVGLRKVYNQRCNMDSAVRKFKVENYMCGIKALEYQKELLKIENSNVLRAWKLHYWSEHLSVVRGIIRTKTRESYKTEYKECLKKLRTDISVPLKSNISLKWKIALMFVAYFPNLGTKIIDTKMGIS